MCRWRYDALNRLTEEAWVDWYTAWRVYDLVGNVKSYTYTEIGVSPATTNYLYNAKDQLLTETAGGSTITYGYDDNGSLTSKATSGGTEAYVYDLCGKQKTFTPAAGLPTTYTYDPDGNRVSKSTAGVETDYVVDSMNPTGYAQVLQSYDGTNKTFYALGSDVIGQVTNTGTPTYLLYDGHGSTRQLVNANLSIQDSYSYDGYGVLLQGSSPELQNNPAVTPQQDTSLLYAGEQFDFGGQQCYNRARWYNPLNGRFNRVDPYAGNTQDPQSLHKYTYVHNNPVNGIDPSGMFISTTVGITIIVICSALFSIITFGGNTKPTVDETRQVNQAIEGAKLAVQGVLIRLSNMNTPLYKSLYTKWFGVIEQARLDKVQKCFEKVQNYLNNGFTWYKKNKDYYAECDVFGRIYFENYFWPAPLVATPADPDSKTGTVIHELTHKARVTKDYTYGTNDCLDLALKSPEKAVKNADNYGYYAEGVQ